MAFAQSTASDSITDSSDRAISASLSASACCSAACCCSLSAIACAVIWLALYLMVESIPHTIRDMVRAISIKTIAQFTNTGTIGCRDTSSRSCSALSCRTAWRVSIRVSDDLSLEISSSPVYNARVFIVIPLSLHRSKLATSGGFYF